MKILSLLVFILIFLSCSKNKSASTDPETLLRSYTWTLDSAYEIVSGNKTVEKVNSGEFLKIIFSENTYTVYSSFDVPLIKNYMFNAPDKIFTWISGGQMNSNSFMTVKKINTNFLHTVESYGSKTIENFFHAE